jgi:hypothetical protein
MIMAVRPSHRSPTGLRQALALALALVLAAGAAPAGAQSALYGVQAPPDASFVRLVNATSHPISAQLGNTAAQALGITGADRIGPYIGFDRSAAAALTATARLGAETSRLPVHVGPGGYATVIVWDTEDRSLTLTVVPDQAEFDQARARLAFYNAAPGCAIASLALQPQNVSIFANVALGSARMRAVNPVAAEVVPSCQDHPEPALHLADMTVGLSYSIWLMRPGGATITLMTRDEHRPYRP